MKDILKYIGLLILIVFSFYYTDRISNAIVYRSKLMQKIIDSKEKYEEKSVDAITNDEYIIPGVNGMKVNELDSYYNMKKQDTFSSAYLVYDEVSPSKSIENNKNLTINQGNSLKNAVSIVAINNENVLNYSSNLNITQLTTFAKFTSESFFEQINYEKEEERYEELDTLLDKYHLNTNICFKLNDFDTCDNDKYKVTKTYEVNNKSIINLEVKSGDIIFVSDDLSLASFKLLLKKIQYRDLDIIFLSNLISEKKEG